MCWDSTLLMLLTVANLSNVPLEEGAFLALRNGLKFAVALASVPVEAILY
jgi:hypothetical protein